MTDPYHIRPASAFDARQIAKVHVQSWRETYPGIVPEDVLAAMDVEERVRSWEERLKADSGTFTFVADVAGTIVGFATGGPFRKQLAEGLPDSVTAAYDGEMFALYLL